MQFFAQLDNNARGILCLVAAVATLTVSDSIIKWVSPFLALHQVMMIRALFSFVILAFIVHYEGGFSSLYTRRPMLHFVRGFLFVLANMFFFMGLASLPIGEVVALFFVAPLFICVLAAPVLGERVGVIRWLAIVVGFVGVLVMVKPGSEVFSMTSLLPILAAFCYAIVQMVTRKLGMRDSAGAMAVYAQFAFLATSATVGLFIGDGRYNNQNNPTFEFLLRAWEWPTLEQYWLLAVCGTMVGIGGYFLSQAYRLAQASVAAPFEYSSLPFALAAGYLIWGDWPDAAAFGGTVLIVISGLMVVFLDQKQKPVQARI